MLYTVYRTTNLRNRKIYIGVHVTHDLQDTYLGSGKAIRAAIRKWGRSSFRKEVLFVFDTPEKMFAKEAEIVDHDFVSRRDTYNQNLGGDRGFLGGRHTPEAIEKIRKASQGRVMGPEARKKLSEYRLSLGPLPKETREKISRSNQGKVIPPEVGEKIRVSLLKTPWCPQRRENHIEMLRNRVLSDSARTRIREARLGTVASLETRERLRISHLGTTPSGETRKKMSESQRLRREREQARARGSSNG